MVKFGLTKCGQIKVGRIRFGQMRLRPTQAALRVLDHVNLTTEFDQSACLMYRVPRFLRGPFRRALHVGLEEISEGCRISDTGRQECGWKLFLSLPRMMSRDQLICRRGVSRRGGVFSRGGGGRGEEGGVLTEGTNFGQSPFGRRDLTNFGQSNFFGHLGFGPAIFLANPFLTNPSGSVCVCHGRAQRVEPIPRKNRALKGGAQTQKKSGPKGRGPKGGAPKGRWPKISCFFFLLPLPFSLFLSLSGCLLVEFWWCLKRRSPQMCPFGLSDCRVKPRSGARRRTRRVQQQHTTTHNNNDTLHNNTSQRDWPKMDWPSGLAKHGLAKIGLAKVGHYRSHGGEGSSHRRFKCSGVFKCSRKGLGLRFFGVQVFRVQFFFGFKFLG